MKVWEAAFQVLKQNKCSGVMWGDESLLHAIADVAWPGKPHRSWRTSKAVLDALSRTPGPFTKSFTILGTGRPVRMFLLGGVNR